MARSGYCSGFVTGAWPWSSAGTSGSGVRREGSAMTGREEQHEDDDESGQASGVPNPDTGVGIGAGEPSSFEPAEDYRRAGPAPGTTVREMRSVTGLARRGAAGRQPALRVKTTIPRSAGPRVNPVQLSNAGAIDSSAMIDFTLDASRDRHCIRR